jgi:hypothetical protein
VRTVTGIIVPALPGKVGSTTLRSANATDDSVTARTALVLPGRWASLPAKSGSISSPHSHGAAQPRWSLLVGGRPGRVQVVLCAPLAIRQRDDRGTGTPLAVADDLSERRSGQCGQPLDANGVGADLRVQVAGALPRGARVGDDQLADLVGEQHRRQPQPLLVHIGRVRWQRPWRGTADVRVVRTVGHPPDQLTGVPTGRHDRDVVEVGATGERIVDDRLLAGCQLAERLDHRGDRRRHGPQVHRDVLGLGEHGARGVEHSC